MNDWWLWVRLDFHDLTHFVNAIRWKMEEVRSVLRMFSQEYEEMLAPQ